ncbi:MAG: class I SAM-dependent methyltransferase [Saprospiraceae bacterium]
MKNCPVCGNTEFESVYELDDYKITHETFSLEKCPNCTLIFTVDPPLGENIGHYYKSDDYLEHSNRKTDLFSKMYSWARDFMFSYKYGIIKKLAKEGSILDIGAGSGHFLNFMSSKGFTATGIEMNERARTYAKNNFGIDVHPDHYLYSPKLSQKFDMISLWHVMEHLFDLDKVVSRLSELLSHDGHLVIALPNYRALEVSIYKKYWNGWDVPRHLWHFSSESVGHLFEKHHFEITQMKMMPLDPFFNTLLTNKYRNGNPILNVFKMVAVGGMSFLYGLINVKKASSIIYIIKKKKV